MNTRTTSRAFVIAILALALAGPESEAANRRVCQRTCKRFTRQCTAATSKPGRCQRLQRRVDKCAQRFADVECGAGTSTTVTPTSSTTTTTIAGAGAVVIVDQVRATTRTVPTWGGTLTARGADGTLYSLRIPSGALLADTAITMTPIVSIAGGDLPDGCRSTPNMAGLGRSPPAMETIGVIVIAVSARSAPDGIVSE